MQLSRRDLLSGAVACAAGAGAPGLLRAQMKQVANSCPFHLAVINDEISPDLDHAAHIAANEFGLHYIELRSINGKGLHAMSSDELAEAKKTITKYQLKVTDIGSLLFKSDLPGAPLSKESPKRRDPSAPDVDQDAQLDRCIEVAKLFETDRIRCFDFWRLDDVAAYRTQINKRLDSAATRCSKQGLVLVLEKRNGLQHRQRCRSSGDTERCPKSGADAELGSRQLRHICHRCPVPGRLRTAV